MLLLPAVLLVCWSVARTAAFSSPGSTLRATEAVWQGRTLRDVSGDGHVTFAWEGVLASFNVAGGATSVWMTASTSFAHSPNFHVYVDGVHAANVSGLKSAPANVTLVQGLSPGAAHEIVLYDITDPITLSWPTLPAAAIDVAAFHTDGVFGPPPPPLARRLQIIGDSITAGNQIDPVTCEADHSGTYGRQLCVSFGANCSTQAISGKGIYQNCCDNNETMTAIWLRTLPGLPSVLWDNAESKPDAVLLNLGTNDQGHASGPAWIDGFVQTYAAFLVNLTGIYGRPDLPIFCGIGPITHDYYPWVAQALDRARGAGATNLHIINYTTPVDRCGHPDYDSHVVMYSQARPIIAAVLGWT
jgi:hypothetical protein